MENGFYWVRIDGDEPEVIEIVTCSVGGVGGYRDSSDIWRCGDDRSYYKDDDGHWIGMQNKIDVVFLSGRLTPPNA